MSKLQQTNVPHDSELDPKKRKKRARVGLLLFRKRLNMACDSLERPEQWYDLVKELADVLQQYTDVIPAPDQERYKEAMRLADASRTGLDAACSTLKKELEIIPIPPTPIVGYGLIAAAIIAAAGVMVVVTTLNLTAVKLKIVNINCAPIPFYGQPAFASWVGIQLPAQPIPTNGSDIAQLPPVTVKIDASPPGTIALSIFTFDTSFSVAGDLKSAALDGIPLLGHHTSVNLGGSPVHELDFTCGS